MFQNNICVHEYPRSGGNWVLKILSSYLNLPYRDLDKAPERINEIIIWKLLGIPPLARFNKVFKINPFNYIVKTHVWGRYEFSKIIYVIRDPRDVFVSYYHFEKDFTSKILKRSPKFKFREENSLKDDFEEYLRFRFTTNKFPYLNWVNHIKYAMHKNNLVFVKYEDMHNDTEKEVFRMLDHLNVAIDIEKTKNIVNRESFENEKKRLLLKKEGFESHLRNGKIGNWKDYYSTESLNFLIDQAHEVMTKFNYL